MSFTDLIGLVKETNAHTRLIFDPHHKSFREGAFLPTITPSFLLARSVKVENSIIWECVLNIFQAEYGTARLERVKRMLDIDYKVLVSGSRPLMNYDVRNILVGMRELYTQDMVEAFRGLKAYIHYDADTAKKIIGLLPKSLTLLLKDEGLRHLISECEHVEDLPVETWLILRSKLMFEKKIVRTFTWEEPLYRLGTGSKAPLSSFTYATSWPFLGINSLREVDRRERVTLERRVNTDDLKEYYYYLSKGMAYRELEPGTHIKAPYDERGLPGYYEVYQKIVTGKGMVAYALRRALGEMTHLPPIILFRGTSTAFAGIDSFPAVMTDIEPVLGQTAYNSGEERLFALLKNRIFLTNEDREIIILGHSLGGTLTQDLVEAMARKENEWIPQSLAQITYFISNSPGVSKTVAENFAKSMNQKGQLNFHGTILKADDDPANFVGEKYLGVDCDPITSRAQTVYNHVHSFSRDPHCDLLLLRDPRYPIYLHDIEVITDQKTLNRILDNTNTVMHHILEFVRLWIARPLIYLLIWPVYQLYLFIAGNRSLKIQENVASYYKMPFSTWLQKVSTYKKIVLKEKASSLHDCPMTPKRDTNSGSRISFVRI